MAGLTSLLPMLRATPTRRYRNSVTEAGGVVTDAACTGNLFRGFELIMNRRDPRDAPVIAQRI